MQYGLIQLVQDKVKDKDKGKGKGRVVVLN
jgi:hypothetical protein